MLMTCRHCRDLRDAVLDGELSESQVAEVHAHLLQCPECQQHIELMRACGDVIRKDRAVPRLPVDFTDRLLARLPQHQIALSSRQHRWMRVRRWVEIGAIPAVAAGLALIVTLNSHKPDVVSPSDVTVVLTEPVVSEPMGLVAGESELAEAVTEFRTWVSGAGVVKNDLADYCTRKLEVARQGFTEEPADQSTFVAELLHPLFDLINPPVTLPAASDDIERF